MSRTFPLAVLPEGYNGKILLLSVDGVGIEDAVVLRSGDIWHREILRNTEAEFRAYGIDKPRISELGGAWVHFEANGNILIYGHSDEFGACDKQVAAGLVRGLFPGRIVKVED